jgi:hypothetical protein
MALLGQAALAMWWDIAPDVKAGFEDWHSHEHFSERLAVPGFRRASRWSSATGGEGVFVLYELESYEILASPPYLARLNAPSPWSTKMMSHHRNMIRSQCRVLESRGAGTARHALTVRLSPEPGRDGELRKFCASLIGTLADRPGLTGAHLLRHETPPIAATTEQKLRNSSDRMADWVLIACGYDAAALTALAESEFAAASLGAHGAAPDIASGLYSISASATPADMT